MGREKEEASEKTSRPALTSSTILYVCRQSEVRRIQRRSIVNSICCGKPKLTMSPLRKQGSISKNLDSCFRRNDKCCFRNRNYLVTLSDSGFRDGLTLFLDIWIPTTRFGGHKPPGPLAGLCGNDRKGLFFLLDALIVLATGRARRLPFRARGWSCWALGPSGSHPGSRAVCWECRGAGGR